MDNNSRTMLPEKPCVVKYLKSLDRFLIGTYEKVTLEEAERRLKGEKDVVNIKAKLEELNERLGSLVILDKDGSIHTNHSCLIGGGVFDLTTYERDTECTVFVAHGNGSLSIFDCSHRSLDLKFNERVHNAKMLTSIDFLPPDDKRARYKAGLVVVGDATGGVAILDSCGKLMAKRNHNERADPVWQVKFLDVGGGRECFILVGGEDSSWSIISYKYESGVIEQLYRCSDNFSAGITCINVLPTHNSKDPGQRFILIGSYDEHIKAFILTFSTSISIKEEEGRLRVKAALLPDIMCIGDVKIQGGGIWRVKALKSSSINNWCLYLTAMYEGSYSLTMGIGETPAPIFANPKKLELNAQGLKETPLYYGIDVSADCVTCCISDFNNSCCHFVTLPRDGSPMRTE